MLLRRLLPLASAASTAATAAASTPGRRLLPPPLLLRPQRVRTLASQAQAQGGGGAEVDPSQYCMDLVKTHDYEAYLCVLLVPRSARRAFFALRAFNIETALVKDVARGNALPAQIRMQWWREVVAAIYANSATTPNHPVARALAEAVRAHGLTRRWLDRVLEARMRDLDSVQPQTMAELEEYAEYTASSLFYLSLESLGIRHPTADHAASHAGKAVGIATLLRGTRYHASQQAVYVPLELQRAFKVNVNDILRGPATPEAAQALADVFYEVAAQAHVHLEHARTLLSASPSSHECGWEAEGAGAKQQREPAPSGTVTALLPAVRAGMYLEALQKGGFDALNDQLLPPKDYFGYQCKLLWANWRGKI